jgi:hypothetical protein
MLMAVWIISFVYVFEIHYFDYIMDRVIGFGSTDCASKQISRSWMGKAQKNATLCPPKESDDGNLGIGISLDIRPVGDEHRYAFFSTRR